MKRVLEPEVMDTPEEADGYDAMDHTAPNESFVGRLMELDVFGEVLDIGTGPGHIPLLLCDRVPDVKVVGVDLAQTMLAHAKRHLAVSKHTSRIRYELADAKRLGFEDASFDSVYSNTILHHVPDPMPFLAEARRVLKPGGVLLIRDLYRPETEQDAINLVQLYASAENAYNQELFRASLCAALTPDELRDVAQQAGLADVTIVIDSDRHMSLQLARGSS